MNVTKRLGVLAQCGFIMTALTLIHVSNAVAEEQPERITAPGVTDGPIAETVFTSELAATMAAVDRYDANSVVHNQEHLGVIIRCKNNRFFYLHGKTGVAPVALSVAIPIGCKLSALWHTHGGTSVDRKYFSPTDTRIASKLGVPIYMSDHKKTLRVYYPKGRFVKVKKERGSFLPYPRYIALGQVVGVGK